MTIMVIYTLSTVLTLTYRAPKVDSLVDLGQSVLSFMFPFIVADVGGTNARFALVTEKSGKQFKIDHIQILKGVNYVSFEEAMAEYVESLDGLRPTAACVAIAGPIMGDQVSMTNLAWSFSQEAVRKQFSLDAFYAINDYTAQAVATSCLDSSGLEPILIGQRDLTASKAILGPGTGLGVAGLAHMGEMWLPISSEGGHANMAPANEFEADVLKWLMAQHGYVSSEMCLSGPGLVNVYQACAALQGKVAETLQPQDISGRALDESDALCHDALNLFCAFLGTVSSNFALTYGAKGGVYITGGIVPRFVEFVKNSPFEERFKHKGKMSHYVENIPVDVVTYKQTAFLGAAAWFYQLSPFR